MNHEEKILSELNKTQQDAVSKIDGPLMVIAGAGSGKTRVLTYRIAYMLTKGINPFNILALTFTNKAANEMKERIKNLVGDASAKAVNMGTFHSVFYKILRVEGEKLGYTRNLTVYDTDDAKGVIKNIVKEMNLDPKVYLPNFILQRISAAKSSLLSAEEYARSPEIIETDARIGKPHIAEIFLRYNARLRQSDAMDFDDLLYYMNVLLRDFPEMLYKYQNRFRYILVDEYQDTNFAQYLIVKKLAAAHHNICVVGDDAQSIYAFRGANIQNILNFKKDFPSAETVKLEQNYRSTQNIVNAANAVIKHNKKQIHKEVWTDNDEGKKINVIRSSSDSEEAQSIAFSIFETKQNEHVNNKDFAILYRTNSQSRALEEALMKMQIPYKIFGGLSFYKRKEIKNILAYFRLAINNYDEEALLRVINYPQRGIGATTVDKLKVTSSQNNVRIWDYVQNPDNLDLGAATKAKLKDFALRIKSFSTMIPTTDAYELGKHIAISSGVIQDMKADIAEKDRLDNVEGLIDSMKEFVEKEPETEFNEETGELITEYFPSLDRFMSNVALLTDEENKDDESQDRVKLMTIHASKGLEFDYVYITGLEENLFPSSMSLGSSAEIEEERRLFYVAVTRARKHLTLTCAQTRYKFGSLQFCEPSRFMEEIPYKYMNVTEKASAGRKLEKKSPLSFSSERDKTFVKKVAKPAYQKVTPQEVNLKQFGNPAEVGEIVPDIRVYHSKFGYGQVLGTDGAGPDKRAVIKFDTVGEKTLLLAYAKLIIPK
ncbi:UvrD-helicase domain-containing protein [Bacteroidales bacterium OttesenSCG-928-B11]|nr:UvrD-helicase domain-containing protein [Bacteroidales bacterium OttesenSCG-928-E04]MDL2308790.1 UvrD-helicase domain-containing protein [Bacteroidales bacterium OttesenSCG-928-C03]MDL2311990.1 UvrD-helicase domain-containing protein [Bacteroidales bacterium OttesenSCG-928-B11]